MESLDLDMGEIFDEVDGDDDVGAIAPLPDLTDATQDGGENEDEDNAEVLARLKDLSKGAAKKVIRKPQPKLDPTRLTGDRGIPILPKVFEKVKFKGKGHEGADLAVMMRYMEHWAHRLFPKMPFDEVIERVEKLGAKNEVKTCVRKMRMDIPVLGYEFVDSDNEVGPDEGGDGAQLRREVNPDEMWNDLLREEAEHQASQAPSEPRPGTSSSSWDTPGQQARTEPVPGSSHMEDRPAESQAPATPATQSQANTSVLTPDVLERMERNKQMAREKRMKKMGIFSPAASQTSHTANSSLSQSSSQPSLNMSHTSINETQRDTDNTQDRSQQNTDVNAKDSVDQSNNEMSEVLGKGTSQNIAVENRNQPDTQNWNTGPASEGEPAYTARLVEQNGTNSQTPTHSELLENRLSEEMDINVNEHEDKQIDAGKDIVSGMEPSSMDMSEVIPKQDCEEVLKLKTSTNLTQNDNEEMSEIIQKQDFETNKLPLQNTKESNNKNDDDKENQDNMLSLSEKLCNKTASSVVNGEIDMTGDHGNKKGEATLEDEFDDDLNEEQLMETLEH